MKTIESGAGTTEPAGSVTGRAWRRLAWAGVAVLCLACAGPRWQMDPDGGLYLMLGENLARGEGYTLFGEPHAFVPPGFPLFLAA